MTKSANRVFDMLQSKTISPNIGKEYLLSDIVDVHKALENRETTGTVVLRNNYWFIASKKSLLFLDALSFSKRNSIASVVIQMK